MTDALQVVDGVPCIIGMSRVERLGECVLVLTHPCPSTDVIVNFWVGGHVTECIAVDVEVLWFSIRVAPLCKEKLS